MTFNPYTELGEPDKCDKCYRIRNIQWLSKTGENLSEKSDWIKLCSKCIKSFRKSNENYSSELAYTMNRESEERGKLSETIKEKEELNKELLSIKKDIDETERYYAKRKTDIEKVLSELENRIDVYTELFNNLKLKIEHLIHDINIYQSEILKEEEIIDIKNRSLSELEVMIEENKIRINKQKDELVDLVNKSNKEKAVISDVRRLISESNKKLQDIDYREGWLKFFEGRIIKYYNYVGMKLPDYKKFI